VDRQALRRVRALRGVVASVAATLLAATAHTLAGAGAPSALLVAITTVLAAPLAVALVGRRPSVLRTSAAVAAAQVVFHVQFVLFADPGAVVYTPVAGMAGHAAHMTMMHPGPGMHSADSPMILAHIAAAVVTIVVLHHAERMLRALGRGIRRLLPHIVLAAPRPAVRRPAVPPSAVTLPPAAVLAAGLSRRGPPLVA
jgi:hypothetical protein